MIINIVADGLKYLEQQLRADPPDLILPEETSYRAILYMGDATFGAEHIYRQWVDVFEQTDVPYFALFRHKRMFDLARKERPAAAMALARTAGAIGKLIDHQPTVKAAFYTGNPGNLGHMMPYGHFKHIFIGHGDSEKATSATRMFRLYDEIWVAGQAHVDRLAKVKCSDVTMKIVGRPQLRDAIDLSQEDGPMRKGRFAYLPTWEGARDEINYSSASFASGIAEAISRIGGSMSLKLHPSTGARVRIFRNTEKSLMLHPLFRDQTHYIVSRERSSSSVMASCDYCITDISSIVSDWVVRKKPLFVFRPPQQQVASSTVFTLESYCYTFSSVPELEEHLRRVVVQGDDYKSVARAEVADYLVSGDATRRGEFMTQVRDTCSAN